MRILLTGGAGFIGSHVSERLLQAGAQLTVVDNLNDFYPQAWKRCNLADIRQAGDYDFFEADVCHPSAMRAAFRRSQPQIVIHLAACAGVRPSIDDPRKYEAVNIGGTLNVLEMCREFQVRKLLFGSSSSVYGGSSQTPFSEDQHKLRPISPYAATKLAGEMLCYTYAHLFGVETICLRFFTVYGPRQRPDLAIHKFTALLEAGKPVPIFGDGSTGRDYTFITDIVNGVERALHYSPPPDNGARFEIINLGNSQPVGLSELVSLLEQVTGRKAIRAHQPMQPGDVMLTWANTAKAAALLGYKPATPIARGLKEFVNWYRSVAPERKLTLPSQYELGRPAGQ